MPQLTRPVAETELQRFRTNDTATCKSARLPRPAVSRTLRQADMILAVPVGSAELTLPGHWKIEQFGIAAEFRHTLAPLTLGGLIKTLIT